MRRNAENISGSLSPLRGVEGWPRDCATHGSPHRSGPPAAQPAIMIRSQFPNATSDEQSTVTSPCFTESTNPLTSHPERSQPSNGAAWDRGRIPLSVVNHVNPHEHSAEHCVRRSFIKLFCFFFPRLRQGCFLCWAGWPMTREKRAPGSAGYIPYQPNKLTPP